MGTCMKIATAAYPLSWFQSWADYCDKMRRWVAEAAGQGADILVFPEYGAMELASLAGPDIAADPHRSLRAVAERMAQADQELSKLAVEFGVYILAGTGPVAVGQDVVNRASFLGPEGQMSGQDKQIMTCFEREELGVVAGEGLQVFDTELGKIGVLICYDSEFPLLGRSLVEGGADVILMPSCTGSEAGYWRVRIGAVSRALEGQCVTVMASVVGPRPEIFGVEVNRGRGGIFGPPDSGFPDTGVMALGEMDCAGWTYGEVDVDTIRQVRRAGRVRNKDHWSDQSGRDGKPAHIPFS